MLSELSLLVAAFLAATILPFSSEAALLLALHDGMASQRAIIIASIGNILAVCLNYFLGFFLYNRYHTKIDASTISRKMYTFIQRYGYLGLSLSWLPIIGDPMTIIAGLFRMKFWLFLLIVALLRIGRYVVVAKML